MLEWLALRKKYRSLAYAQEILKGLDMEIRPSIVVPREHTVDPRVLHSEQPFVLALVPHKPKRWRERSSQGQELVCRVFELLPARHAWSFASQEGAEAKILSRGFAFVSVVDTLGRLKIASPRRGIRASQPITAAEAVFSVKNCGMYMGGLPPELLKMLPLQAEDGNVLRIRANPKADNGLPVGGKWSDPKAQAKVWTLALDIRATLEGVMSAGGSVEAWKEEMEDKKPWLVTLSGKAKDDYYSEKKYDLGQGRFYNVVPRQVMVLMQQATQPFGENKRNILEEGVSAQGVSLVRGGADALIRRLEEQLQQSVLAYTHCGDDTLAAVRVETELVLFSLDASNFDLTQEGAVTLEVKKAVHTELARYDRLSADWWLAFAKRRQINVVHTLVRRTEHGGVSGMPLQSEVNDVIMDADRKSVV